jgi:phytoene dehydrogenase-like protein
VGGSTHPGNGVPLVLMSSKLTTQRIIKENKQ